LFPLPGYWSINFRDVRCLAAKCAQPNSS
jgi:hypothetical protein